MVESVQSDQSIVEVRPERMFLVTDGFGWSRVEHRSVGRMDLLELGGRAAQGIGLENDSHVEARFIVLGGRGRSAVAR